MDPITSAALISGGAGLLGSVGNWFSQSLTNNSQRDINQRMYDQQRRDALSDWERTNAYNSPVQQMQRLREAGLNPNLVYGSGAQNTAAMVRSTNQASYSPIAPKIDVSPVQNSIGMYYDLKAKQAQTNNVEKATELAEKEKLYKDAQIASLGAQTADTKFRTQQAQSLNDMVIERAKLDNQEKAQDIYYRPKMYDLDLQKLELNRLQNSNDTARTFQSIIDSKIRNARSQAELDQFNKFKETLNKQRVEFNELDLDLRRKGINPQDPTWLRMIVKLLEKAGIDFND